MSVKNRQRIFADMDRSLTGQIIDIFISKLDWTVHYIDTDNNVYNGITDGQLQVNTSQGVIHLACTIKKSIVPSTIPPIEEVLKNIDLRRDNIQGTIILANYISTKAREMLIKKNINYADTGGNVYLKFKDIHIEIETGQSDRSALSKDNSRAFTKTGLKVIHQFFRTNQKIFLNDTYRKIAEGADVSKDTVAKVIIDLLDKGYIIRRSKTELIWRAKSELFEMWVQSYNQILRPTLFTQKFKFVVKPDDGTKFPPGYPISGYYGAKWHNTIPPDKQIINPDYIYYTHLPIRDAIKNLQLIPGENGNVTIIEAFWKKEPLDFVAVDAIINYADLANTKDPRYLDIAKLIYKKYFHDNL